MSLLNEILEYIKANEGTSFVEIEQIFERNKFEYKGDLALISEHHENLVFWDGWNKEAIGILGELLISGKIERKPIETFLYCVDGKVLNLPIAKRYQKYAKPRWFPIAFTVSK